MDAYERRSSWIVYVGYRAHVRGLDVGLRLEWGGEVVRMMEMGGQVSTGGTKGCDDNMDILLLSAVTTPSQ